MAATVFDTLKFVDKLTAAGIPEAQARAITDAQREALSETLATGQLATKVDVDRLAAEIEKSKAEMKIEIEKSKVDVIKSVAGLLVAQAAVVSALVKLL